MVYRECAGLSGTCWTRGLKISVFPISLLTWCSLGYPSPPPTTCTDLTFQFVTWYCAISHTAPSIPLLTSHVYTSSMEQSPWEADSSSAFHSWHQKVHCYIYNSLPLILFQSQINQVYTSSLSYSWKSSLLLSILLCLGLPSCLSS
jgi:hypothetical protein